MLKKIVSLFLFSIAGSAFSDDSNLGFAFENEAINPACVGMFNSSMSDFPYIKSINLTVCQKSNAAAKQTLKNAEGELYYYENDKDGSQGSYGYKVVGKSKNGIYVLSTYSSGGGTGIFSQLLLVQLKKKPLYVFNGQGQADTQSIVQLNLVGYVHGGDRCSGSFSKVEVDKNTLKIQRYLGINPSDCTRISDYTIDLGTIPVRKSL